MTIFVTAVSFSLYFRLRAQCTIARISSSLPQIAGLLSLNVWVAL
jgi:hypothetical protein